MMVLETVATVPILARSRWNRTGLILDPGVEYHLEASGIWFDAGYRASADGYSSPTWFHAAFERWRRMPAANWFALIGSLDGPDFLIGRHALVRPERSAELRCYANDMPGMRWNNRGDVELRVSRVR